MAEITWEDGLVKIDGKALPGEFVSASIGGAVRFDEQETDGSSGKKKTPLGWEDSDVTITLDLLTDPDYQEDGTDCYEKLEAINKIFKGHDDSANPKILNVTNRHMVARGISTVVFSSLTSDEDDQSDTIQVTLGFVEHNPPVVKTEKQVAKSAHKKATDQKQSAGEKVGNKVIDDLKKGGLVPKDYDASKPQRQIDLNGTKKDSSSFIF